MPQRNLYHQAPGHTVTFLAAPFIIALNCQQIKCPWKVESIIESSHIEYCTAEGEQMSYSYTLYGILHRNVNKWTITTCDGKYQEEIEINENYMLHGILYRTEK